MLEVLIVICGTLILAIVSVVVAMYRLPTMLEVLIVICGTLILAIVSGVTTYWNDIVSLSGSAAAFLGALAGAGGGLLAIILGALINAELNRHRDDRLRREEIAALMKALASEMKAISTTAQMAAEFLREQAEGFERFGFRILEPARTPVFEANAEKIGWIPDRPRDLLIGAIINREVLLVRVRFIASGPGENRVNAVHCEALAKDFDGLAGATDEAAAALRKELPPAS
jgi:MFS family permease